MDPLDIGTIPEALFAAGAVQYWNFFRFDFDVPYFITDFPGGFVGDIADGSGSQTWLEKIMADPSSSQGAKNPLTVDAISVDGTDGYWGTFIRGAANGVSNFNVGVYVGWFDADDNFVGAYADGPYYIDAVDDSVEPVVIALKSQTVAHGTLFPDGRYTNADYPTMPLVSLQVKIGSTVSKQPSVAATYAWQGYTPPPNQFGLPKGTTPFDTTNSNYDRKDLGIQPFDPLGTVRVAITPGSPASPDDPRSTDPAGASNG